jgi:hypothetical protein
VASGVGARAQVRRVASIARAEYLGRTVLEREEPGPEERGLEHVAGRARGAHLLGMGAALALFVFQGWVRLSGRTLDLEWSDWRVEDPGPASSGAWPRARETGPGRATTDQQRTRADPSKDASEAMPELVSRASRMRGLKCRGVKGG